MRKLLVLFLVLVSSAFAAPGPLSSSCVWSVMTANGNTNYGAGFDPSQTAGMITDLAAYTGAGTSPCNGATPTVKSATYSFVAGDQYNYIYIASGTAWYPGWYKISAVSTSPNYATLDAAVGHATLLFAAPYGAGPTLAYTATPNLLGSAQETTPAIRLGFVASGRSVKAMQALVAGTLVRSTLA